MLRGDSVSYPCRIAPSFVVADKESGIPEHCEPVWVEQGDKVTKSSHLAIVLGDALGFLATASIKVKNEIE
jgi:hypothetical protein